MTRSSIAAVTCVIGFVSSVVHAQDRRAARVVVNDVRIQTDGALSDALFPNAPFSADAVTTVTQTLADGTKIEQRTTAKWYRDSSGRVRREQTVIGLDRLNPSATPQTTISFDSVPGDPMPYTLNPATKTARRAARGLQWFTVLDGVRQLPLGLAFTAAGGRTGNTTRELTLTSGWSFAGTQVTPIPADAQRTDEQLGTRQVEGVKATGRRSTTVIAAGRIGNDRPIQIVEEQWESPELNMVISSRFSDPRTGVVEYRLTNINRAEPRAELFSVPSDYTIIDANPGGRGTLGGVVGPPPPPQPGQRGGARGGRGN
jgi:hypothetical protein